jgi:hypothetical protein
LRFIFHHNHQIKEEKRILCSRKMGVLTQVDANKEINIALIARVGTVLSTLSNTVKTGKTLKSVMHNAAGSLVKGKA